MAFLALYHLSPANTISMLKLAFNSTGKRLPAQNVNSVSEYLQSFKISLFCIRGDFGEVILTYQVNYQNYADNKLLKPLSTHAS